MKLGKRILMIGLCTLMTVIPCFAQTKIIALNNIEVTMNTQTYNNRNYVQLKELSEYLGYNLSYNVSTKVATLTNENKTLTLSIEKGEAKSINGRIYAPIATVVNYFGDSFEIKDIVSRKNEFINKLDNIQADVDYLFDLYENEIGYGRVALKVSLEAFEKWDNALNEIYDVLKTELSPIQMTKLKQEQLNWITYRDNEAQKAYDEWGEGSFAPVMYSDAKVHATKERCYQLIDEYMP